MKTWVKVYTKALDSPDIGTLTWAHRGIFDALILLAGRLDYRDDEDRETGQLDTLERAAWRIRCNVDEFREAVSAFIAQGMVTENDGCLYLANYYKHQRRGLGALWQELRAEVMCLDEYTCQYCGAPAQHVDHIVPRCQGGTNDINNLVAACAHCNLSKGGRTPEQAGMELR